VVVLDSADCRRGLIVDDGGGAQVRTKFIGVVAGVDQGPTLAKKFLQVSNRDDSSINIAHFDLTFGQSALHDVKGLNWLLLIVHLLALINWLAILGLYGRLGHTFAQGWLHSISWLILCGKRSTSACEFAVLAQIL